VDGLFLLPVAIPIKRYLIYTEFHLSLSLSLHLSLFMF
jgi:hypothetical protein